MPPSRGAPPLWPPPTLRARRARARGTAGAPRTCAGAPAAGRRPISRGLLPALRSPRAAQAPGTRYRPATPANFNCGVYSVTCANTSPVHSQFRCEKRFDSFLPGTARSRAVTQAGANLYCRPIVKGCLARCCRLPQCASLRGTRSRSRSLPCSAPTAAYTQWDELKPHCQVPGSPGMRSRAVVPPWRARASLAALLLAAGCMRAGAQRLPSQVRD